jgi:hypothetical protein
LEAEPPTVEVATLSSLLGHDDRIQILNVHALRTPGDSSLLTRPDIQARLPSGQAPTKPL